MQLPRPRAPIASPFPIRPLLLECRAQRRSYSAAPALAPRPQPAESQPQTQASRQYPPSPPQPPSSHPNTSQYHSRTPPLDLEDEQDVPSFRVEQEDTSSLKVHNQRVGSSQHSPDIDSISQPALKDAEAVHNGAHLDRKQPTAVIARPGMHLRKVLRNLAWKQVFFRNNIIGSFRGERYSQDNIGGIIPSFDSEDNGHTDLSIYQRIRQERGKMRWSAEEEDIVRSLETSMALMSESTVTYLKTRQTATVSLKLDGLHEGEEDHVEETSSYSASATMTRVEPRDANKPRPKKQRSGQNTVGGRSEPIRNMSSASAKEQAGSDHHRYHKDTLPGRLVIKNIPGKYRTRSVFRQLLAESGLPPPMEITRLTFAPLLLIFRSKTVAEAVLVGLNGRKLDDKILIVDQYRISNNAESPHTAGLFIRGLPPVWRLAEVDMFLRDVGAPIPLLVNRHHPLPTFEDDAGAIEYFCSWDTDRQIDNVYNLLQGQTVLGHELFVTKYVPELKMQESSRTDQSALDDTEVGRRSDWLQRIAHSPNDSGLKSSESEPAIREDRPSYGSLLIRRKQQVDKSIEHRDEVNEIGLDRPTPSNSVIHGSTGSLGQSIMDVNNVVRQLSTTINSAPDFTSRQPAVESPREASVATQPVESARGSKSHAYQPIVVPNNENYIMDSLKSLTEVTQQLLKALTMKQQQQDPQPDMHATPTWPNPPRVRRPPTFEDKLRDQVGTTTLEQLGNPNPEGEFAQLVEGIVNMNESEQDRRRIAREKLRSWNRYSSLDHQRAETTNNQANKPGSNEEHTEAGLNSIANRAFEASQISDSTIDSKPSRAQSDQKQGIDLFNQLFGGQTKSSLTLGNSLSSPSNIAATENLVVPTIRYDQSPASSEPGKAIKDTKGKLLAQEDYAQEPAIPLAAQADPDMGERTVLLLRGVSSNLAEDDIRRVAPKGKHLAGWFGNKNLLHVFPRRDRWTLKHQGAYWLVFRTRAAADEYKKTVKRLHALAAQYTPTSIISPILPTHDQKQSNGGFDVSAAVKSFTLAVPGQRFELAEHQDTQETWYKNLFLRGGYPQIMTASGVRRPQVMLSFDSGFIPSQADVEASIHYDGKRRMVEWRVDWPDSNAQHQQQSTIVPFPTTTQTATDPSDLNPIPQQKSPIRRIHGRSPTFSYDKDGNFLPKSRHTSYSSQNSPPNEEEAVEGFGTPNSYIDKDMRSRWLIAFKDEVEAKRFALAWHRRPLPMRPEWIEEKGLRMEGSVPGCVCEWLW